MSRCSKTRKNSNVVYSENTVVNMFVGFVSLSMDCISYFEGAMKNIEADSYNLIEVKRNEEKSISDLLNNLEFKDDVDEVTKRWMRR